MDGEIGFRVFNDFRTAYRDNERSGELLLYLLSNDRGNGRKDALGNRPKRKFSWDMASGRGAIRVFSIGFVSHPVLSSATSFEESEDESACIRSCDSFPRSKRRASGILKIHIHMWRFRKSTPRFGGSARIPHRCH